MDVTDKDAIESEDVDRTPTSAPPPPPPPPPLGQLLDLDPSPPPPPPPQLEVLDPDQSPEPAAASCATEPASEVTLYHSGDIRSRQPQGSNSGGKDKGGSRGRGGISHWSTRFDGDTDNVGKAQGGKGTKFWNPFEK